jgi:dTDP-4-amino-4,6-dideoxygalactose transaminase
MRELSGLDDKFYRSTQITSRMDEVQAAVLRVKLRHLNAWISERRRIAAKYFDNLPPNVTPVSEREDFQHLFVVRCDDRDALASHLSRARIGTKVHFPVPLDRSEASWSDPNSKFPQADRWCASVLSLPCYPGLTEPEIDRICFEIERFHQRGGAKHAKAG